MPEKFTLHEETDRTDALVAELAELWERSVRATHDFLAEGGVEFYKPYVVEAIKSLPLVMTARADGKARGLHGNHRRAPRRALRRAGILRPRRGRSAHARSPSARRPLRRRQRTKPRARRFYEKHGFQTTARRETDDCGNPYPILRMELPDEKN